jgi:Na+-translocating ferredoxin:NAD+ oxidoreductase subunit C
MSLLLNNPVPFPGGIHLPSNKEQSLSRPLIKAALPAVLTIPVRQHIGTAAEPVVNVGDHVLKGQEIAKQKGFVSVPIHASSSGTVIEITEHPVPTPSGYSDLCIVIKTDGKDEWITHERLKEDIFEVSPIEIHNRIQAAGIVGLGGAGFPSSVKMLPGIHYDINLLVLNAAECEPYISCDEALMRERADEIIDGLEIMRHAVQASECVIGIEVNKTEAITALTQALDKIGETSIRIMKLPPVYPTGGEKQLIKSLTGLEVPTQGLPPEIGIVCYNVGTIYAVHRAVIYGEPLLSRVVTITGDAIKEPCNFEVLIGTPINELVKQAGGYKDQVESLLLGGPMMGFNLKSDTLPITKTSNCIIAAVADEIRSSQTALPCIRCGDCASVCPVSLLPQQLYWFARSEDYDKLQEYKILDCIECGCCSYVCPSHIPLVQYYQAGKTKMWDIERQHLKSIHTRDRYQARQKRLHKEREESDIRRMQSAEKEQIKKEIDASVERVKARKEEKKKSSQDKNKKNGEE